MNIVSNKSNINTPKSNINCEGAFIVDSKNSVIDLTKVAPQNEEQQSWYDYASNFVWDVEVTFVSKHIFDYFIWPSLKEYISSLTGSEFVIEGAKTLCQAAFIAGAKKIDLGALYSKLSELLYSNANENKNDTQKTPLVNKLALKGVANIAGVIPKQLIKHSIGINIPLVYFSNTIESFYNNTGNLSLTERSVKAIEEGVNAGTRNECIKYGVSTHEEATENFISWLFSPFSMLDANIFGAGGNLN